MKPSWVVIGVLVLAVLAGAVWLWYKKTPPVRSVYTPAPSAVAVINTPSPVSDAISLTITAPTDGAKVSTSKITVSGKTSPGADVSVNDTDTTADSNGSFSLSVSLDEGDNYLVVLAVDADGKTAQKQIMVTLETF